MVPNMANSCVIACSDGSVSLPITTLADHFHFFSPSSSTSSEMVMEWRVDMTRSCMASLSRLAAGNEVEVTSELLDGMDFLQPKAILALLKRMKSSDLALMNRLGDMCPKVERRHEYGLWLECYDERLGSYLAALGDKITCLPPTGVVHRDIWHQVFLLRHDSAEMKKYLESVPLIGDYKSSLDDLMLDDYGLPNRLEGEGSLLFRRVSSLVSAILLERHESAAWSKKNRLGDVMLGVDDQSSVIWGIGFIEEETDDPTYGCTSRDVLLTSVITLAITVVIVVTVTLVYTQSR